MNDANGLDFLRLVNEIAHITLPPIIVYTDKDLSNEEMQLLKYSTLVVFKGVSGAERLLDDVSLFLHYRFKTRTRRSEHDTKASQLK